MSDFLYRLCLRLEQWLMGGRSPANVAAMRALDYDHYVRSNRQPPTKYAIKSSESKSDISVRLGRSDVGERCDTEDRRRNNHFPKRWDVSVNSDEHASANARTPNHLSS